MIERLAKYAHTHTHKLKYGLQTIVILEIHFALIKYIYRKPVSYTHLDVYKRQTIQ